MSVSLFVSVFPHLRTTNLPGPDSIFQDKVTLTLSCLSEHLQIHGDTEPSPVVLGEQTAMEKTTQRFQKIATTLADFNAEGLNAQAVNDLLTMIACSKPARPSHELCA